MNKRVNALVNDACIPTRPNRSIPKHKGARRRIEEIKANKLAVNADLRSGIPAVTNMVVRSILATKRIEDDNASRQWTAGAFMMLAAKYGEAETREMLTRTHHNALHIEHAAQLWSARTPVQVDLPELDMDGDCLLGDLNSLWGE